MFLWILFIITLCPCFIADQTKPSILGDLIDAKCSVESVEYANSKQLHSILQDLLDTTFFRLFKVNLKRECQFPRLWQKKDTNKPSDTPNERKSDGTCPGLNLISPGNYDTTISTCSLDMGGTSNVDEWNGAIDKRISQSEDEALSYSESNSCIEDDSSPTFWLNLCHDIDTESSEYINLRLNPERNTGYPGSHIWQAIYEENCFVRAGSVKDMCYEERVLYRLLSGMHTSINIHISLEYFPPIKGKRSEWMPNPQRFVDHYSKHPERLKNLHFAFVVLLRAIHKAAPYLENYPFIVGSEPEDTRTKILVKRLLDSHVLQKCGEIFSAFDESLLFKNENIERHDTRMWYRGMTMEGRLVSLKQQFKGVFRNISRLLDCVSCQSCKLHAKLQLLGIGTALKILLMPLQQLQNQGLSREEVVALVNTIGRWSHSITSVQELAKLYEASLSSIQPLTQKSIEPKSTDSTQITQSILQPELNDTVLVDRAVGIIAILAKNSQITEEQEKNLIDLSLSRNINVMILSKHYYDQPQKFAQHALRNIGQSPSLIGSMMMTSDINNLDAIVVGGGLAGLTTALTLLDRGARIAIIEKESFFGGNSAWASSGINAVTENKTDSIDIYMEDMIKASGYNSSFDQLIRVLTTQSGDAVKWLQDRVGIKLDQVGQLGGHTVARTHRPSSGLAGAELIFNIGKIIDKGNWSSRLTILKKMRVTKLIQNDSGHVIGVEYVTVDGENPKKLYANNVVLTTGGYANDHSESSLLQRYVPDLMRFPTTNGRWTTGDGQKLAMAIGADVLEMENVQVHPTGFVDPQNPDHETKTLCAEILRGEGGILLDKNGMRFCNELGTRNYVVEKMLQNNPENPKFTILLNRKTASATDTHISLYTRKGILHKIDNFTSLASFLSVDPNVLQTTFDTYNKDAINGIDEFGKKYFHNAPYDMTGPYYVGTVTPVLHYCMGGLRIDTKGSVLRSDGTAIRGLYAAGEIIGGIHGMTRLGGNALTECVVFGRVIGETLNITVPPEIEPELKTKTENIEQAKRVITNKELQKHNVKSDCWVNIGGLVYNLSSFVEDHPGGPDTIIRLAGTDGTNAFNEAHSMDFLDEMADKIVGEIEKT